MFHNLPKLLGLTKIFTVLGSSKSHIKYHVVKDVILDFAPTLCNGHRCIFYSVTVMA
jgi:hypothetical protein